MGTAAKQWIKEGKQAVKMTRLSCHRFLANEVRLQLSVLAYNLGNLVAAHVAAEENRPLVADELAAMVGEDWRAVGETCPALLPPVS
jgi:hypothetical protein